MILPLSLVNFWCCNEAIHYFSELGSNRLLCSEKRECYSRFFRLSLSIDITITNEPSKHHTQVKIASCPKSSFAIEQDNLFTCKKFTSFFPSLACKDFMIFGEPECVAFLCLQAINRFNPCWKDMAGMPYRYASCGRLYCGVGIAFSMSVSSKSGFFYSNIG